VLAFWWRESGHMGDEELNFTEEEARIWADDPRNQAPKSGGLLASVIVACVLLLIVLIAAIASKIPSGSNADAGQIHVGVLFVL